mmetsp:Transcript_19764/g.42947  ORF Transcript_19764/g.42947 Transcript_19764/m.42947 type:complete len:103 (+) Transcript_19764:3-311(+)
MKLQQQQQQVQQQQLQMAQQQQWQRWQQGAGSAHWSQQPSPRQQGSFPPQSPQLQQAAGLVLGPQAPVQAPAWQPQQQQQQQQQAPQQVLNQSARHRQRMVA